MHYRYRPYPYYRRYYNLDPYYYRRYYNPYNIFDSQIANVDQSIINYGDMADTSQDSVIYQLRTPAPDTKEKGITTETVEVSPEPVSQWRNSPEQLPSGEALETIEE
jgi:hypothetical protein